jgi:hypothetical protein
LSEKYIVIANGNKFMCEKQHDLNSQPLSAKSNLSYQPLPPPLPCIYPPRSAASCDASELAERKKV